MTVPTALLVGGLVLLAVGAGVLGALGSVLLGVGLAATTAGTSAVGLALLLDPGEADAEQR